MWTKFKQWLSKKQFTEIELICVASEADMPKTDFQGIPTMYCFESGRLWPIPDKPHKIFVRLE